MRILAISGSLRKESFNTRLLRIMRQLAPAGVEIELATFEALPHYSQDAEADFPKAAQALKDRIAAADAVVIATPEYNRSVPGVLKNAIDWASRPYGKNAFAGKPVLVCGVSSGKIGTAVAQSHLKQIMVYLDAKVVGQPELYLGPAHELFGEGDSFAEASTKELVEGALAKLAAVAGK